MQMTARSLSDENPVEIRMLADRVRFEFTLSPDFPTAPNPVMGTPSSPSTSPLLSPTPRIC